MSYRKSIHRGWATPGSHPASFRRNAASAGTLHKDVHAALTNSRAIKSLFSETDAADTQMRTEACCAFIRQLGAAIAGPSEKPKKEQEMNLLISFLNRFHKFVLKNEGKVDLAEVEATWRAVEKAIAPFIPNGVFSHSPKSKTATSPYTPASDEQEPTL